MSNFDDLDVENLLGEDQPKKKKIKSGLKGKSAEREICHLLNERFSKILSENPSGGAFSRSVGSGNRWGQKVILSDAAKQIYSGDITCPEKFLFVVESKKGYNDIDLCLVFLGKCPGLDAFLKQVEEDAERVKRLPILVWKKDRKPAIAFIKQTCLYQTTGYTASIWFKDWLGLPFEELLAKTDDNFWFKD